MVENFKDIKIGAKFIITPPRSFTPKQIEDLPLDAQRLIGQEVTISDSYDPYGAGTVCFFKIEEDGGKFLWHSEWISKVPYAEECDELNWFEDDTEMSIEEFLSCIAGDK